MVWQPVRTALLFGAVAAVAVSTARADCNPAPAPCAPAMRTITVTECVPEQYQATRTAYKVECKQETYTAYKTECVPETRTRVVTTYKRIPEMRTEVRNVCVRVPCVETRTVMKKSWHTENVTTMVCRTVDRGHYECREVPDRWADFCNRVRHSCSRHDCCEPCPCPATKTVKCWVPCKVTEQVPVTHCKRVCVETPCTVQVTVYRTETRQETHQVCSYRCVPEQRTETYTVNTSRCVPYQATRTVRVCVPYQETVTCTRMVARQVTRQVPCEAAPAASSTCGSSCGCDSGCGCSHGRTRLFRFSGLGHRGNDCGCGCN
jgi:hypothetical protein